MYSYEVSADIFRLPNSKTGENLAERLAMKSVSVYSVLELEKEYPIFWPCTAVTATQEPPRSEMMAHLFSRDTEKRFTSPVWNVMRAPSLQAHVTGFPPLLPDPDPARRIARASQYRGARPQR